MNPQEDHITADVLMAKHGKYSGAFQEVCAFAEYRASKRFGFGGGLNVLSLDVNMDDDIIANFNNTLTGVVFYEAVYL